MFKSTLTSAFKTGVVDYVAGLDGNHNVQDNNEDCRDFNKIIKKNLSPYGILKSKNSEAQAEQVIKYLKQEFPKKIDALFKKLAEVEDLKSGKKVAKESLSELKNDQDLNSKFSEWTNEQLKQFHQKLAEKFIPNMEPMKTEYGTEVVIKHHQNSKVEGIKKSVIETLKNFKDAFCSDGEFNIPKKFSVFSFNNEADCKQYLCGNSKKFGKSFITNDKNGENSIYLYPNKEANSIETLKQWIV